MTCCLCNGVALRIGSKGKGYCKQHQHIAFADVAANGVKNATYAQDKKEIEKKREWSI